MGIVTNYICDVSGKSGTNQEDFISVIINADNSKVPGLPYGLRTMTISKLVHIDIARKLGLVHTTRKEDVEPEITFESKLKTLLYDYIDGIVEDAVSEHMSNAGSR